jgi:argininosuccinate lyase
VRGSQAYAKALARAGILSPGEASALVDGLTSVAAEWAAGTFVTAEGDEDIHTANERRLGELIGESSLLTFPAAASPPLP